MLSRNRISYIRSLQIKKFRNEHRCFVAEGSRLTEELLQSRLTIQQLYATAEWLEQRQPLLKETRAEVISVSDKELSRISAFKTANQAIAVVSIPEFSFDKKIFSSNFVLMLDDISDPGNLGTILRTADWFGIYHVICSENTVDIYNPKTVQSTMGSIARMSVYYCDLKKTLDKLKPGTPVYGSLLDGKPLNDIHFARNGIILIGNEAHGISKNLIPYITHPVLIPSAVKNGSGKKRPDSLNAAVAASIFCWQAFQGRLLS